MTNARSPKQQSTELSIAILPRWHNPQIICGWVVPMMIRLLSLLSIGLGLWLSLTNLAAASPQNPSVNGVCDNKQMSSEVSDLHRNSALLRAYDLNCDGLLDRNELLKAESDSYARLSSAKKKGLVSDSRSGPTAAAKRQPKFTETTTVPAIPSATALELPCPVGEWSSYPILRETYGDVYGIGGSDCPPSLKGVKGAQFSWGHNGINANDQWLAKGVAGVRFLWLQRGTDSTTPYLNLAAVAPTVRFQRLINSNSKLQGTDIDILAPGVTSEFMVNQLFDPQLQLYFRARGNVNGDFEGRAHSWSATFEIQPIYFPLHLGTNIIIGSSYWTFSPLVRAQYFSRVGNVLDPLFLTDNRVFRVGPALALNVAMLDGAPVPPWLRALTFSATYTQYEELLRSRTYGHLNAALTYNVTENFGVSLNYERGRIDETGQNVDLTTVALSVKY